MMMTRRAVGKDMEDKLRKTLKELESSKSLCQQLLQERDDSEVEVKIIIDKNTSLKNELAELHIEHMDILDQNTQLQQIVSSFQHCSDTHELALNHITDLELKLTEAHKTIVLLQSVKVSEKASDTQKLYDELVGGVSVSKCAPAITIDLTGDTTINGCPPILSHNKLKKYIKIKKLIRLFQNSIRKQKKFQSNVNLRKERMKLATQLKDCYNQLDHCRSMYEVDMQRLQDELLLKEKVLVDIFNRYEHSQNQLSERMLEASELVDLVKYNAERFESLTNNLSCNCANSVPPLELQPVAPLPEVHHPGGDTINLSKSVLFSDKLGAGLGSILQRSCTHNVSNNCYPNLHFNHIIDKIASSSLDNQTTLILLIGNSIGVRKKDIVSGIDTLLKLNLGRIMLCALPYSDLLSDKHNNYVHTLNNIMYMLTCRHSDKLLYFDTNQFVSGFILSQEAMFLPKKCRHLIATLIAYNINTVVANTIKTRLSSDTVLVDCTNNTVFDCLNY